MSSAARLCWLKIHPGCVHAAVHGADRPSHGENYALTGRVGLSWVDAAEQGRTGVRMFGRACHRRLTGLVTSLRRTLRTYRWARPVARTHVAGTGGDLLRSRAPLRAAHALQRRQPLVLRRGVARPAVTGADRALLVLLAGHVRAWRHALLLVQPETLLRWHRAGFRARWRRQSRPGPGRPPLAAETVALIRRLASENPRWGAERIRGELRKLGLRVAKRTIQADLAT